MKYFCLHEVTIFGAINPQTFYTELDW